MRIPFKADDTVAAALRRVGRTEDVQYSPSGRRLALVGLLTDLVLILEVDAGGDPLAIDVSGALEVSSSSFSRPHGVAWLDERTMAVANRGGEVAIVELPPRRPPSGRVTLEPVRSFGADRRDLVKTPGSVSVHPIGLGLVEILVCSNFVRHVSRHLIDQRNGYAVLGSESLIDTAPHLPDGVEHSGSGRWIAVSDHDAHCVLVFRNDDLLHEGRAPDGVLRGVCHAHGLAFTPDEKWILAADADAPFVHAFRSDDGAWQGEREPVSSIRVLDDDTYDRGHFAPGEGGPKGIDLAPDGTVLAVTCREDRLAFFDMRPILGSVAVDPYPPDAASEAERVRAFLLRYLDASRSRVDETTAAIRRTSEREIQMMLSSRWWRLIAPLRRMSAALIYAGIQARHMVKRQL